MFGTVWHREAAFDGVCMPETRRIFNQVFGRIFSRTTGRTFTRSISRTLMDVWSDDLVDVESNVLTVLSPVITISCSKSLKSENED